MELSESRCLSLTELSSLLDITAPFLMLDSLTVTAGSTLSDWRANAHKQLSTDDWFFACHLPSQQAMPATLITEGMLQTLVSLIYCSIDHGAHRSFVTHLNVHLQQGASAGDRLSFDAELISCRRGLIKGKVQVYANEQVIGRGEFQYASPHLMALPVLNF